MFDLKEIKSIEIVPYTLMTSSVSAVWAFIYAIVLAIVYTIGFAITPTPSSEALVSFYIASIVSSPVSSFVFGILQSFLFALIYNLLVPRLGGIKLGLVDLNEIKSIPVVPLALITSAVSAVMVFLFLLIIVPLVAAYIPVIAQAMSSLPINGTTIPATSVSALGAFGIIGSILSIIIIPIVIFIVLFIVSAITAVFYNVLAPRLGGIKLEFAAAQNNIYEILSIAPVQLALIIASVATVWMLIVGIIGLIISALYGSALMGVGFLVGVVIGGFVFSFIVYAILALIYNFLRPRIGGVKLELE